MPFRRRSTSKIRHLDVSACAVESIVIDYDGAFKWCHVVSFAYCIPDAKLSLRPCLYKQSRIIKVPAQSGPFHCCFPSNKGGGRSIFLRHILFKHQQSTTFKGKGKEGIPLRMSGTKPWFCHPPVGIIKTIKVLCHTSFKWLDIYRIFQQQPNPSRSNHLQARYSRVLLSSTVYTYLFHLSYMYVSFFFYVYILVYIYIYIIIICETPTSSPSIFLLGFPGRRSSPTIWDHCCWLRGCVSWIRPPGARAPRPPWQRPKPRRWRSCNGSMRRLGAVLATEKQGQKQDVKKGFKGG